MPHSTLYNSPIGPVKMTTDGMSLTGLEFIDSAETGLYLNKKDSQFDSVFEETRKWLDVYFKGELPVNNPPLSLYGTEFQLNVWKALTNIPYGETVTYGNIAKAIGCRSARAVGRAISRNPIAILVPCHRVIGTEGRIGGYAYGVERKMWLLEQEEKRKYLMIDKELIKYIEQEILPKYEAFDTAHRRDHADMVIRQSLELAVKNGADRQMAYAIAAFHDLGLCEGRELHHEASARIIRSDKALRRWFSEEEINIMADAAEDHRASSSHPPRTIYGRIVSEADRCIIPESIARRAIQYGLSNYPSLSREEHFQRMKDHLREKYGRNGYLHLWFSNSPNAERLEHLRQLIEDEKAIRKIFEDTFDSCKNKE